MRTLLDQLSATMHRFADEVDGYQAEIVRGSIMLRRVRPVHGGTVFSLWTAMEPQLPPGLSIVSGVAFPLHGTDSELCPEIAVIPADEADRNLSRYPPRLITCSVTVTSPESVHRDYHDKASLYAQAEVPVYAIVDPYAALCTVHHAPDGAVYAQTERVAYGQRVVLPTPVGRFTVDTGTLPVDPGA